jgi:hypothetical protein
MKVFNLILKQVLLVMGILAFIHQAHGNETEGFIPPAVGPTNLNFTNVGSGQMTLNWTSGDGETRIVIVRTGSAVTSDPVNGVNYNVYQTVSAGEVVVYKGTGNSFVFKNTGLGPLVTGTNYYFEIFEFNGTGATTEYLTTSTAVGNQIAQISTTQPTTAATTLNTSALTGNSMNLTWTSGNGSGRIVVARQGSAVNAVPTDGKSVSTYQTIGNGNVVVYNGTGNSFSFGSMGNGPLTINTTYHFAVFEYNGTGTQTNYNTSLILTGSATTLSIAAEPAQAVSGATLTFRTDIPRQRMDISWTGGNGVGTMVIMRAGSAPDEGVLPQDGVNYAQWTTLAANHYVCYRGSGNSFTLTSDGLGDLAPNTTYHFRFIEFNGSGVTSNYLTSATFSFNATTTQATPAAPATSLGFATQSGTSQTVSWTNGGGTNRLVIAKQGSAVNYVPYDLPADGTSYTVGQNLGSGNFVVFNGSANTFLFNIFGGTALQRNTTYHFAVIEYTGSGSSSNYLTENGGNVLTGNITTPNFAAQPTTASTGLVFSAVSSNSMTLTWANGDGARRIVTVSSGAPVAGDPVDGIDYAVFQSISGGGSVIFDGTGNSVVFNNDGSGPLVSGTTYHFEIFEYNGNADITNYLLTPTLVGSQVASTSTVEPTVAASSLSFTNVQTDQMTLNWANGDGTNRLVVFRQGSAVTATPQDGMGYSTFQSLSTGQMVIYNGTGTSVTFSNTGFGPLAQNTAYHFAIYEFNGSGSATNYLLSPNLIGSQSTLAGSSEPTVPASNLSFTSVLSNEMTLNWTSGNGTNRLIIYRLGSAVTAVPVDGTSYSNYQTVSGGQFVIYNGTGSTYRFTNGGSGPLAAGTTYHFAIFEFTGTGSNTNYLTSSFLTGSQSTTGGGGGGGSRVALEKSGYEQPATETIGVAFAVYPNPAEGTVNFSLPEGEHDISISTPSGAVVFQKAQAQKSLEVDITRIPRGIYFVILQNQKTRQVKKLLVR